MGIPACTCAYTNMWFEHGAPHTAAEVTVSKYAAVTATLTVCFSVCLFLDVLLSNRVGEYGCQSIPNYATHQLRI